MQDLNLNMYEVLPVEPLHDLKEHINNVLKELPKHLTKEEKALFEEAVEAVISTKEKLRGAGYRLYCVVLALHLGNNCYQSTTLERSAANGKKIIIQIPTNLYQALTRKPQ